MEKSKTILRVAHKTNINEGMYHSNHEENAANKFMNSEDKHPIIDDDIDEIYDAFVELNTSAFFGFKNKSQLKRWIHRVNWIRDLHEKGFVVYYIKSDEIYHGKYQSIFDINSDYEIVKKVNLVDL